MNHPGMSQPANSPHAALDHSKRPEQPTKYDEALLALKAQSFWVYVVIERRREMTSGGLYIPKAAKDMFARVIDVGPEVSKVKVKPGDLLMFTNGVSAIPLNYIQYVKDDYSFVHEGHVLGVMPEGAAVPHVFETDKK